MATSTRQPYPFPQLENDDDFTGSHSFKAEPYSVPVHIAQTHDPWNRLNQRCTLSSARRDYFYRDPQAPNDSLDFVLKTKYNHHNQFLAGKNETLLQPETLGERHGRVLKNRIVEVPPKANPLNHPLIVYEFPKKESIDNIHNAIPSHHSAATNGGYSRKQDGGFYCP